ncbi:MAG: hypothetical protein RLZZ175_3341, partial [Bacteroidota bacterium]
MRTIELCKFEKKISEINNNLSHLIFVFNQFSLDNNSLLKENQEKLTED